jgi:hypothetical protein
VGDQLGFELRDTGLQLRSLLLDRSRAVARHIDL